MTPKAEPKKMEPATSLEDAANSDNSMMGYAAINDPAEHEQIARLAYQYYEERRGAEGSAEEDWHRAEQEIRRKSRP
jgi:DUF2934 family protein